MDRLIAAMNTHNVDALALIPGPNLRYLTGLDYHLMERPIIGLYHKQVDPVFVIPTLEQDRVPEGAAVFTYADGTDPAHAVREAVASLPEVQRLGVEYRRMRVLELKLLQQRLPVSFVVDAEPVMAELRRVKTAEEIDHTRSAVSISEAALEAVITELKPGMTERDVAFQLMAAQVERSGGGMPFSPIVLFGERTPLPHGMPSNRTLQHSDPILIDFGTSVNGYMSDITRCFFFGEPDAKAREVYEVVLAANTAGREAAGPGVPAQDVDRAARQVIEEAGYGEYFIHRTGHGLGIDAHEEPYIVEGNSQHLEPGMCFTVEPGIYIPGEIGIRIEDDLIITGEGAESLSTFPREIRVLNGA